MAAIAGTVTAIERVETQILSWLERAGPEVRATAERLAADLGVQVSREPSHTFVAQHDEAVAPYGEYAPKISDLINRIQSLTERWRNTNSITQSASTLRAQAFSDLNQQVEEGKNRLNAMQAVMKSAFRYLSPPMLYAKEHVNTLSKLDLEPTLVILKYVQLGAMCRNIELKETALQNLRNNLLAARDELQKQLEAVQITDTASDDESKKPLAAAQIADMDQR
ncbi:MAG: hypothetical protein KGR16_03230 [Verrucomicrobia bacterium]|nr:hypothetical protein [Verrucomicrobiota bacterium]